MEITITGKITNILPLQTGTGKTGNEWKKQEIIIQTEEAYPKSICLSLWGNAIDDKLKPEDKIKASIDIESREFNGKWYTSIKAWKIELLSAPNGNEVGDNSKDESINGTVDVEAFFGEDKEGDVPF